MPLSHEGPESRCCSLTIQMQPRSYSSQTFASQYRTHGLFLLLALPLLAQRILQLHFHGNHTWGGYAQYQADAWRRGLQHHSSSRASLCALGSNSGCWVGDRKGFFPILVWMACAEGIYSCQLAIMCLLLL